MITLKEFLKMYRPYSERDSFSFGKDEPIQVIDNWTNTRFRVSEGGTPTLKGDLVPGLTTKEALLNLPVVCFSHTPNKILVWVS